MVLLVTVLKIGVASGTVDSASAITVGQHVLYLVKLGLPDAA